MSATVFGTSRFGVTDDVTATNLHIASLTYTYATEQVRGKNSGGESVALAIYDPSTEVSASGIVAVKATGLAIDLADVIVLANESADSLSLNDQNMPDGVTAVGSAGTVVTGGSLERSNSDFETGSLTLLYLPLVPLS
jgi:hypothetical protein